MDNSVTVLFYGRPYYLDGDHLMLLWMVHGVFWEITETAGCWSVLRLALPRD